MCRSMGALQVLHLGTCYSLRGYPGQPRTVHPRETIRQTSLTWFLGAEFGGWEGCRTSNPWSIKGGRS
jgi:hypothetical protein